MVWTALNHHREVGWDHPLEPHLEEPRKHGPQEAHMPPERYVHGQMELDAVHDVLYCRSYMYSYGCD